MTTNDTATIPRLLGVAEVAALLQVRPNTVSVWRRRRLLPAPDYRVRAADLWLEDTIKAWAAATRRLPDGGGSAQ